LFGRVRRDVFLRETVFAHEGAIGPRTEGQAVVMAFLGLLMAEGSGLRVKSDKREMAAPVQILCYGFASVSSRYARGGLRCTFTENLHGVDVCLILDQFGELITCPIQEGRSTLSIPSRLNKAEENW
jgi:hypothetical protein